jgi:hypothetical protein
MVGELPVWAFCGVGGCCGSYCGVFSGCNLVLCSGLCVGRWFPWWQVFWEGSVTTFDACGVVAVGDVDCAPCSSPWGVVAAYWKEERGPQYLPPFAFFAFGFLSGGATVLGSASR